MNNKEKILKKAINKAKLNGWKDYKFFLDREELLGTEMIYGQLIWDHDFAKAFWGEEFSEEEKNGYADQPRIEIGLYDVTDPASIVFTGERWQYHLQQMILEEEPLKYLEKFL